MITRYKAISKFKAEIVFLLAALIFVIYKIPHLSLPLFWDEMGVYGKSIFYLIDHEIGFQPKYLQAELSRGHPMLFVFLASIFTKLFGSNVAAMHLFALVISLLTLFSVFYIGTKLWNKKIGLFAVLLLLAQPMFVAQSAMILPEMMLSLFFLWIVFFFLKEKWLLYFLACSLALMTKETTLYLPLVLGFVLFFYKLIFENKFAIKELSFILSPFLVFFAFLLVQKAQNGWYFFPYHNPFEGDKGFFDINTIILKFKAFYTVLFIEQGRNYSSIIGVILFVPMFFTWKRKTQYQVLTIIAVILGLLMFSATNHFVKRYMLVGISFYVFIVALVFGKLFKSREWLQYVLIFILMLCSLFQLKSPNFDYANNMSYLTFLDFQKDLATFLENQDDWQNGIYVKSSFPMSLSFEDKRYGFAKKQTQIYMNHENKKPLYFIETNNGEWKNYKLQEDYEIVNFEKKAFNSVKIFRRKK
ncbi:MAG: glycosyltransferase family 39 protein [Chitinophagales bacterium]